MNGVNFMVMDGARGTLRGKVKTRLKSLGKTQVWLAKEMGLAHAQTLTKWLDRESVPPKQYLKFCKKLQYSPDDLLPELAHDLGIAEQSADYADEDGVYNMQAINKASEILQHLGAAIKSRKIGDDDLILIDQIIRRFKKND